MTDDAATPTRGRAARASSRVLAWFAHAPVSVILLALCLAAPVIPGIHAVLLATVPGQPVHLISSIAFAPNGYLYVLAALAVAAVGPPAERAAGSWRFALRVLIGHLAALGLCLLLVHAVGWFDAAWAQQLTRAAIFGPWGGLLFAVLAGSAAWPGVWRRRVMTLLLPVTAATALFSGSPQDAFLLIAVLLGAAAAAWQVHQDPASGRAVVGSRSERRVLVAVAVGAVVLGSVLALDSAHLVGPLAGVRGLFAGSSFTPEQVAAWCADDHHVRDCARGTYVLTSTGPGAALLAVIPLGIQLILADGLRRGRHAAFIGTLLLQGLLATLAAAHLAAAWWTVLASPVPQSSDTAVLTRLIAPVLVPLAVIALVWTHRSLFQAQAPRGTYRTLVISVVAVALAALAVIVLGGQAIADQFAPHGSPGPLLVDGLIALLPSTALTVFTPLVLPQGPGAHVLLQWVPLAPWLVLAVLLWRALRPLRVQQHAREDFAAHTVRFAPASATMAWMGTWTGNRVWFSPTRDAAIAYRVHQDVAVTVGDPVCAEADLDAVVEEFAHDCVQHTLIPAFYSVHPLTTQRLVERGWFSLQVAEEAVIHLGQVAFAGKRFQDLRTAQNRAAKEGITARWCTWGTADADVREQIEAISAAWVAEKELPEMGFTLGGLAELKDERVRLVVAVDEEGVLHGVTSWLPIHDAGRLVGLTLDFMRRAETGFRPVMEFLLGRAVLDAQEEGLQLVSLSGAPLARSRDADSDAQAATLERLTERLGTLLEPLYGFRSLHAFKEKFGPTSVPLHLCLPDAADLPRVGLALTRAYVPSMSLGDVVRAGTELRRQGR
ncbi:MAG: DUF2156 domain-containing protein [Micrococcus sp.]|nr:DUF2156 domain-containing protein [Micrococcus sp.]